MPLVVEWAKKILMLHKMASLMKNGSDSSPHFHTQVGIGIEHKMFIQTSIATVHHRHDHIHDVSKALQVLWGFRKETKRC